MGRLALMKPSVREGEGNGLEHKGSSFYNQRDFKIERVGVVQPSLIMLRPKCETWKISSTLSQSQVLLQFSDTNRTQPSPPSIIWLGWAQKLDPAVALC